MDSPSIESAGCVVCIGASVEMESLDNAYSVTLQLNDLRIVTQKTLPVSDSNADDILEKCSVNVSIRLPEPSKMSVAVAVTPIHCVIGTLGLLNIAKALIRLSAFMDNMRPMRPTVVVEATSVTELIKMSLQLFKSQIVSLTLPSVRVVFVSNRYSSLVPVALIEVCDGLVSTEIVPVHVRASASFKLIAHYYKKQFSQWETCIEPFSFSGMYQNINSVSGHRSKIVISSVKTLNINLTHPLLSILSEYEQELYQLYLILSSDKPFSITEDPSRQSENVEHGDLYNKLCLVNHSGLPITVDISDGHSSILLNEKRYQVANSTALYTSIPAYPSLRTDAKKKKGKLWKHHIERSCDAVIYCDNYQKGHIPIFGEDIIVMKSISNQALVARSQTSFGRKEVLVSGRVDVVNNSGIDLFYGFASSKETAPRALQISFSPLPKTCQVYAPVSACTDGALLVATSEKYSIFEQSEIARLDIAALEKGSNELCISVGRSRLTLRVFVTVTTVSSVPLVHIELLPGLKIHNLLYCNAEFTVMDIYKTRGTASPKHSCIEGDIGLLSPLEYYYAYSVPVDLSTCLLSLRLPGETTALYTKQAGLDAPLDRRSSAISAACWSSRST